MEQLVTIELFGQPYTFKAQTAVGKAQEVADILAKEVAKVQTRQVKDSPGITHTAILIIAALNIVNENIELKENHIELLRDLAKRSADLIHRLDVQFN